ncbi:MAG: C10 family peptidase [Candidatus Cloacimonetes bacterium]|nr:C10 family peptidase [Candidatus Cloacimonadota bacterium]
MKRVILSFLLLLSICLNAKPATEINVKELAQRLLSSYNKSKASFSIDTIEFINNEFFLVKLDPQGFILIAKDTDLNPVMGYSFRNNFSEKPKNQDIFTSWFKEQQDAQLQFQTLTSKEQNNNLWNQRIDYFNDFEQWPPEGSTTTGGWVESNWTQSAPFNNLCPIDPTSNSRSIAGCPSIAMGQIINYHKEISNTIFNDNDKYVMYNSSSNTYSIDDDYQQRDFPNFEELNTYLSQIQNLYNANEELDNNLKAALVFASGVAIRQSYSSDISGNFFNHQIINGFHKFGYNSATLLYADSPMVYERLIDNMKSGLPAQLSALTPDGSGHQIVIDGYNTNEKIHMNFGWGGQSNGWYNIPLSGLPYQLNTFGAIVLDINQEWTNSPEFTLNINNNIVTDNILSYTINSISSEIESYKVFINNELIGEHFTDGTFQHSISNLDNAIYQLTVIAISNEDKLCVKDSFFDIQRGEIIYQESFDDDNWFFDWEIISSNQTYTWNSQNNILESFSFYDSNNVTSMTCPVAYTNLNEKLKSPIITLPESNNLNLSFFLAMADQYPNYPGLKLEISSDNGSTWNLLWQNNSQGDKWNWRPVNIDLSIYSGNDIILQFITNGFSYVDVSIDNIKIYDTSYVSTNDTVITPITNTSVYPNPFYINQSERNNSNINISFEMKQSEKVSIDVFDIRGRKVAKISDTNLSKGQHNLSWNMSNIKHTTASGIYFIRVKSKSYQTINKVLFIK